MPNYPREQLWELYMNLPKELQTTIFSEETANKIYDACTRNDVKDDATISGVARQTGYVLLGVLLPDELQQSLEKELALNKKTAKQIAWEISRFVFLPVKNTLEALYKIEIKRTVKPEEIVSSETGVSSEKEPAEKTRPRKSAKDRYRESTE